ncbi:hypothetical protein DFJ74DRAFT_661556 [Hyaloraphidium curvatum]|nr:hypothetical protein DFJ74DRAFT_661556 [Hyaloraphidium curvatum]
MANLALLFALSVVAGVADHSMDRNRGGRAMLRHMYDILGATGVPRHRRPHDIRRGYWGLDDLLLTAAWIGVYWLAFAQDCTVSMALDMPTLHNPPRDHPGVPANLPAALVASVPAPTDRPPNGPIPAFLLRPEYYGPPARDYLGWIDPLLPIPSDNRARDRMLATHVSAIASIGHSYLHQMTLYAATRIIEFRRWLAGAELSVLDVLLAKEVAEKAGSLSRAVRQPGSGLAGMDAAYLERLSRNPFLPEAIRRRDHLYEAVRCLRRALPAGVATAGETGHIADLAGTLPDWDVPQRMAVLGWVGLLILSRQMSMSLCSPELFEDLDGWGRSAARAAAHASPEPAEPPPPPEDESDMLRTVWFSSASFGEASRHAMVISRQARSLVSDLGPQRLGLFYFTGIACRAAISASWLHLLVLKRFRHIAARAAPNAQARAVAVYEAMAADVRACLELLGASDLPPFQDAKVVLRSILEGDEVRLARADVQILTLARAVAARCPHAGGTAGEGACWICAVRRQGGQDHDPAAAGEGDGGDPLLEIPEFGGVAKTAGWEPGRRWNLGKLARTDSDGDSQASSAKPRRRVKYHPEVRVFETYAREEYPARSMLAPDEEEDTDEEPPEEAALRMMVMLRVAAGEGREAGAVDGGGPDGLPDAGG